MVRGFVRAIAGKRRKVDGERASDPHNRNNQRLSIVCQVAYPGFTSAPPSDVAQSARRIVNSSEFKFVSSYGPRNLQFRSITLQLK